MERYILHINSETFLKSNDKDLIFTSNHKEAKIYESIGAAMKEAAIINERLGTYIVKVLSI